MLTQQSATTSAVSDKLGNNSPEDKPVIIIADDDPAVAQLYSMILSKAGFIVGEIFFNGFDVVEYFLSKNPFRNDHNTTVIVIMDQTMPKMDGVTAALKLRQLKKDLKIVAATGCNLSPQEITLFDRVLIKPFGAKELIETVRSLLMMDEPRVKIIKTRLLK